MPHVTGQQRNQMMMFSLESAVAADSFARVIDAFVDATDLESFGFCSRSQQRRRAPLVGMSELCKALKKCCLDVINLLYRLFLGLLKHSDFSTINKIHFPDGKLSLA